MSNPLTNPPWSNTSAYFPESQQEGSSDISAVQLSPAAGSKQPPPESDAFPLISGRVLPLCMY